MHPFDFFKSRARSKRDRFRERRREECGGGYEDLSPARIAPIFDRVTAVPRSGFVEIRSGWWVRPGSEGAFDVLHFLRSSRGYDYRFRWGVSLPWVPRITKTKLRWHRTLKSAVFDLWDQPPDYLITRDTPWADADRYFPDRSLGETCFEEDLTTCWALVRPAIEEWWQGVRTSEGVLARAQEQSRRNWESARHSPDPQLVAAFTLARLGRIDEAEDRLEKADEFQHAAPGLRRALRLIADAGPSREPR